MATAGRWQVGLVMMDSCASAESEGPAVPVVGALLLLMCSISEHLSPVLQGQPMWMEHVAGIDVVGMQAAGVDAG